MVDYDLKCTEELITSVTANPNGRTILELFRPLTIIKPTDSGIIKESVPNSKILYYMLEAMYELQTNGEQSSATTKARNGVGFNSFDARFLSSVYENARRYQQLSSGQAVHVAKALKKYKRQLLAIPQKPNPCLTMVHFTLPVQQTLF